MAKAKGKSKINFDFKKFFLEKGEKVGLIVAGIGLALMALMGVMAATKAASPGTISKNLKDGAQTIDTKLHNGPDTPVKVTLSSGSQAFRLVKVTEFPTDNFWFNPTDRMLEKRVKPMALPPETGQAIYAIGGIGVYDIIDDKIATIVGKTVAQNDLGGVKQRMNKKAPQGNAPKAAPAAPPPASTAPPAAASGAPKGPTGGPGGGPGKRTEEKGIAYIGFDDPSVATAELAVNLKPERMAVIRAIVPYKAQVDRYLKALRLPTDAALEADKSAPIYRGFEVERLVMNAKGEVVKEEGQSDWQPFNHLGEYQNLLSVTAKFETEDERFRDFVPDSQHKLYLWRPRLENGGYSIPAMPAMVTALDEMKKAAPPRDLTPREKKLQKKEDDLFKDPNEAAGTSGSGGAGGPPGKGSVGSPVPPPAPSPKGAGGPPGKANAAARNNTMPVWILQFIDPTIEPGYSYKYRVRLKLENPNLGRTKDVANPSLAEELELVSEWTEIPDVVHAPREEYLYASGVRRPEDDTLGTSGFDKTTFRFHKWTDYVRVTKDSVSQDPIGAWIIADIDGMRGQYIHQQKKAMIPLWSMVQKTYILRQKAGTKPSRSMENVDMDFLPSTPVLLVDFQGGSGYYRFPSGIAGVKDDSTVETLLITDDGRTMAVTARNAAADKEIPEKKAREDTFRAWLEEVVRNTGKPN